MLDLSSHHKWSMMRRMKQGDRREVMERPRIGDN
jgi:hypothetical protein